MSQTQPNPMPLLEVKNLSKRFALSQGLFSSLAGKKPGYVDAVTDVSFELFPGETVGLVGESGCGKTTLSRCLLQLLPPTSGQVLLEGEDLTRLSSQKLRDKRKEMQLVFQNPYSSLNPRMRVSDILAEPYEINGLAKGKAAQLKAKALLDLVGLPETSLERYPHEFSGGQRQRICIARALALNPKLIIADEPVSALDVSVQAQILNLLEDLKQELGLTYLFISHNLGVVEAICDRVMVMYLGQVVESAPTAELFANPQHPYTQSLLQAIPLPEPALARERLKNRHLPKGEPPNPVNPPSGCRFHPRCPKAEARCAQEAPVLETHTNPTHLTACHYV